MTDSKSPIKPVSQNFIINDQGPKFATRVLASITTETIILSFGIENPGKQTDVHVHTRIALPISVIKSLHNMMSKITTDIELKKTMHGMQYNQIPSDS